MMWGIKSALLSDVPGVSHRFFTRIGGTSPRPWAGLNTSFDVGDAPARVEENLARVRFQIGVGRRRLFSLKQVHGARVVEVVDGDPVEPVPPREGDALLTREPALAVGVRTADCAPILLVAADGSAVAAVHAGWRGAVGGVIEAAVAALGARGVPAADLRAAVGPCIGLDAFEVGMEVIEAAQACCDLDGLWRKGREDRAHLDLGGLCLRLLRRAEVGEAERVGGCTASEPGVYFSHRRDRGRTGRQLAVIARTEPPMLDDAT